MNEFLKNPKNFLVFCGKPGIGKTHFCACLVEWALTRFNSFRYWTERSLLSEIRSSIDKFPGGDYLYTLEECLNDDFIILDDVGSTGVNEWRSEILFAAIDHRYNSMLPTVITSNFSIQQFESNFHPRLASRLFDKDNSVIEIFDGPDFRRERCEDSNPR